MPNTNRTLVTDSQRISKTMPEGPEGSENKIMPNDCLANYCKRTENTKGLKKLLELATAVEACDRITAVAQYLHSLWACNQYMAHYHASALTSDLTLTWGRGGKSKRDAFLGEGSLFDIESVPTPVFEIWTLWCSFHWHPYLEGRSCIYTKSFGVGVQFFKSFYIELWSLHLKKKLLSWQQRSENNKASYRPKHLAKLDIHEDKND